jgi:Protein of unknown function (DUF3551)
MLRTTVTRAMIAAAALAAAMWFHVPPSRAFGDAPWCAVIDIGNGEAYWDCQYNSVAECAPNVAAGNRGYCNPNPEWRGPYAPAPVPHPKYRRRHLPRYR